MRKWIDGRRVRRGALPSLASLAVALAAVGLASGCGSSSGSSSGRATTRKVVQVQHAAADRWTYARERFREACGGCHTLADAGTRGRRFDLDHDVKIDESRARWVIEQGEPGMPAWAGVLSRREFEELVAYVSTVQHHTAGETNWSWQMALRTEGEKWTPDQAGRGPDHAGGVKDPSGVSTHEPLEPRAKQVGR
jgi:mono/diheme cytochrome c family protein